MAVTTIKYLFFNDPIGSVVYLRPSKECFDETEREVDRVVREFKNVKGKIDASCFNARNAPKAFD